MFVDIQDCNFPNLSHNIQALDNFSCMIQQKDYKTINFYYFIDSKQDYQMKVP